MLTLTSLNGQEKGREFQLTGEVPELLGRQAPTIQLSDAQASRRHAEIFLENNTWLVRDLDSTNGTWVNGQKITQITELEVGDRIVIGRHQFRVSTIDDLPAPTPRPLPIPAEPLLGDEALGEMGVDLGESLSADILDDAEPDLPELPDSAIDGEADDALNSLEQPQKQAEAPPSELEDGVIDLDALLGDDQSQVTDSHIDEAPQDLEPPPATSTDGAQGVIDIDDLLADEPAAAVDDSSVDESEAAPAEEPTSAEDEPEADAPIVLDDDAPAPTASDQSVDFDLDEFLGEESTNEPPAEEPVDDIPDDGPTAGVRLAAEPPSDEIIEHVPPPTDADGEDESDSIDDIDAMLEGLGTAPDSPDEDDILASAAPPTIEVPLEEEDAPVDGAEPEKKSVDEASAEQEPDSLIDIDILATAAPAVPFSGPGSKDAEPPVPDAQGLDEHEAADQGPDESGIFSDDSDSLNAADTGMDIQEDPAATDDSTENLSATDQAIGEASEHNEVVEAEESEHDQALEAEEIDSVDDAADDAPDEPLTQDLDDQAQLQESERELLLTEQEQSKAVTSYKRSKLVTLSVVILLSAAVGLGGWYAFNHFANRSDTNDRQTHGIPDETDQSQANPVVNNTTPSTTAPPNQDTGRVAIPDITPPPPKTGIVRIPDIPDKTPTTDGPTNEAVEDTTPKPAPGPGKIPDITDTSDPRPADASPVDHSQAPDPFEDVDTSVFDTPPTKEPGSSNTPADQPNTEPTNQDTTNLDATIQNDPVADSTAQMEADPSPDSEASNTSTTPDSPQAEGDLSPVPAPVNDTAKSDPNQTQLNILAGIIDANNKPGVGVNEQAAMAGARRIIYLVDASGSLVDSFPLVLNELKLSIDNLQEDQAFTAIFFGADGVTEIPPNGLKWADPQTKRDTRNWIDPDSGNVTAWGRGDLMQALKRATDYGADEIVVLSDNLIGRKPSQEVIDTLLDDIANLTAGKVEKINVIQFFSRDPKQVLKTIAERFNGSYSLIPAIVESSAEHPGENPLVYP